MKPITFFSTSEGMYKGLAELLACRPESKVYDDGAFRIIHVPAQPHGKPVIEEPAYIIMQYHNVDCWEEHERWLVVADDGEHPNGYASLEEATVAMQELQKQAI